MTQNYGDQLSGHDMCGFVFSECTTNNEDRIWEVEMPNQAKPPLETEPPYPDVIKILQILQIL